MQPDPLRWIVLFFTRPIHIADATAFLRALKPRPKPTATPPAAAVEPAEQLPRPRPRPPGGGAPRPAGVAARDPALDVAVTEQPLDTLPANLQSEFGVSVSAAADAAPGRPPSGTMRKRGGSVTLPDDSGTPDWRASCRSGGPSCAHSLS